MPRLLEALRVICATLSVARGYEIPPPLPRSSVMALSSRADVGTRQSEPFDARSDPCRHRTSGYQSCRDAFGRMEISY